MSISRFLIFKCGNSEKLKILLMAATGVAATNMDRKTIYKELRINVESKLYLLKNCRGRNLQNKLADINFIIIDEISIVSNIVVLSCASVVK